MSDIDLTTYLPDYDALPADALVAARQKTSALMYQKFPDIDTRPGSVFGDLYVTPAAYQTAALETAASRMLSDMDVGQVANGVIYNCDFVKSFLESMGAKAGEHTGTVGLVLLKFEVDHDLDIPSDTRIVFGDQLFNIQYPNNAGLIEVGPSTGSTSRTLRLSLVEDNPPLYGVLLPVIGSGETTVKDGDLAMTDIQGIFPELAEIVAVGDFAAGYTPTSLVELAQKLPTMFPSSNTSTPAGLVSWVRNNRPDVPRVSVVLADDVEMERDASDALAGYKVPRTDLYVGGKKATMVEYIRLGADRAITGSNQTDIIWRAGQFSFQAIPDYFVSGYDGIYSVDHASGGREIYNVARKQTIADSADYYADRAYAGGWSSDDPCVLTGTTADAYFCRNPECPSTYVKNPVQRLRFTVTALPVTQPSMPGLMRGIDLDTGLLRYTVDFTEVSAGVYDGQWDTADGFMSKIKFSSHNQTLEVGETYDITVWAPYVLVPVTYVFDTAPMEVAAELERVNLIGSAHDLQIKPFKQLSLTTVAITYRKLPGISVARGVVATQINDYLATLSSPVMLEASALSDIVLNNGAAGVVEVVVNGKKLAHPAPNQLTTNLVNLNINGGHTDIYEVVPYAPAASTDIYTFAGCKAYEYGTVNMQLELKGI